MWTQSLFLWRHRPLLVSSKKAAPCLMKGEWKLQMPRQRLNKQSAMLKQFTKKSLGYGRGSKDYSTQQRKMLYLNLKFKHLYQKRNVKNPIQNQKLSRCNLLLMSVQSLVSSLTSNKNLLTTITALRLSLLQFTMQIKTLLRRL